MTLLRQRNFGLAWFAGLISLIGDRALLTALPFYVYQQTGSTLATAAMFAAAYVPMVLLGSVAGVFVDRWNRQRLMVNTSLLQAAVIALLLLVHSTTWFWLAYVIFFIETCLAMFFQPAESALLPQLVEPDQLVAANGLNALNNNIARLIGPPIGGVVLGLFGLPVVALLDSATFLIAALLLALMRIAPPAVARPERAARSTESSVADVWREWIDGMRFMGQNRIVLMLLVVAGVTSFGGAMFDPLIDPWVLSVLGRGPDVVGWLSTAGAVGGLIGGALLSRFGKHIRPIVLLGIGNMLAGLLLLLLYNVSLLQAVLALALVKSLPLVASSAGLETLFQISVADTHRGRVFGAVNTTNAVLGLLALGIAGLYGELFGIVPILSVAAGLTILSGVLALVLLPRHIAPNTQAQGPETLASIATE